MVSPRESGKFLDVPVSRRTGLRLAAAAGIGAAASTYFGETPARVASLIDNHLPIVNAALRAATSIFPQKHESANKPAEAGEGVISFPSGIGQIDFFEPEESEAFLANVLGHENMNKFQEVQAVGIIDIASEDDMKKFTDLYRANEDYAMVRGALQKLNSVLGRIFAIDISLADKVKYPLGSSLVAVYKKWLGFFVDFSVRPNCQEANNILPYPTINNSYVRGNTKCPPALHALL